MLYLPKMLESGHVGRLIEASAFQVTDAESRVYKQGRLVEKDYDASITEEKLSLSQYYSHFADGTCEVSLSCGSYKTSPVNTASDKNLISYNVYKEQDMSRGLVTAKKPKIWKCTYNCGKIFTQEKYMRNHILVMHENTNLIQCKICFQYLSTNARLKNHMLRHAGVDHLVCLICINKRANDRSCMRHHLSQKHGISGKHSLFHESYYEMSLKEISLMKKNKNNNLKSEKKKEFVKHPSVCKKSANDIEELKWKIMEKSKRVKKLLNLMKEESDPKGSRSMENEVRNDSVTCVKDIFEICYSEPQKILIAENGMKLMKLPNGQFKKISSN